MGKEVVDIGQERRKGDYRIMMAQKVVSWISYSGLEHEIELGRKAILTVIVWKILAMGE